MKTKRYIFITTMLVIPLILIFVHSCHDIEQIDGDEEDNNQFLLCYLFDNTTGEPLQDCNICVISSLDQQEYSCISDSLAIKNIIAGRYSVLVEKENYVSETRQVEIQQSKCESCGSIYPLYFYLTPMSSPVKIGTDGGDITFKDGTILHFPEGALNEEVNIIATQIPAPSHPNQLDWSKGRIPLMEINVQPEGLTLNTPVILSVPVQLSEINSFLLAGHYNIESSSWEGIKNGTLNEIKTHIEFQIGHFSTFSVISPCGIIHSFEMEGGSNFLAESSCGGAVGGSYDHPAETFSSSCFTGGKLTIDLGNMTNTCQAKTNYITKLYAKVIYMCYTVSTGNGECDFAVPDHIKFECDRVSCHDQGGSQ